MFRISSIASLTGVAVAHKTSLLARQSAFVQTDATTTPTEGDSGATPAEIPRQWSSQGFPEAETDAAATAGSDLKVKLGEMTAAAKVKVGELVEAAKPHVEAAMPVIKDYGAQGLTLARDHGSAAISGGVALVNEISADPNAAKEKYTALAKTAATTAITKAKDPENLKWAGKKALAKTTKVAKRTGALIAKPLPLVDEFAGNMVAKIPEGNAVSDFIRSPNGTMIAGKSLQAMYLAFAAFMLYLNFWLLFKIGVVGSFFVDDDLNFTPTGSASEPAIELVETETDAGAEPAETSAESKKEK